MRNAGVVQIVLQIVYHVSQDLSTICIKIHAHKNALNNIFRILQVKHVMNVIILVNIVLEKDRFNALNGFY